MPHTKIKYIQVFGMMCSGTTHMYKLLLNNVPKNTGVEVVRFLGWKHGDIWSFEGVSNENNSEVIYEKRPETHDILRESLVIVVYRNPLTWLQSYHRSPHQAPKLFGLDFASFIRSEVEYYFAPPGHDMSSDDNERLETVRTDRLMERYPDIATLRQQKILMYEAFKYKVPNVCYVNLETLNKEPEKVLEAIAEHYEIKFKSKFTPNTSEKHSDEPYRPKEYAKISRSDLAHLMKFLHLPTEESIGYELRQQFNHLKYGVLAVPKVPHLIFAVRPQLRMYSYERGNQVIDMNPQHTSISY